MAKDKKGFILYADQKELFDQLPNEKAGELIKHIFKYVNDEEPISKDLIINLAFTSIKQQLKRDLKKYEDKLSKSSTSGREGNLKRWHLDLYKEYKKGTYTLLGAESIANGRKASQPDKVPSGSIAFIADKDNVNDKDNVKVKVKDINKDVLAEFKNSLKPFLDLYGRDMLNDFYNYWTEKGDRARKYRWQKEKTWSLERRLQRWKKNDFGNNTNNLKSENNEQLKQITSITRELYPDL